MAKIIIRLANDHPMKETIDKYGGKVEIDIDSYDMAFDVSMVLLDLDDRFEKGDTLLYNNGILIEIDR